ncbi:MULTISPECIES: hypothetical protein [unclassified Arthrobacter]|uniref:hypothetical protein n=1 Tax=unclassified Arthrobacter TaxID=235627 RepID=UPI001E35FEDE|nr:MULTISPECIES: hypothetical protein [unclassified Arthrobacter]MCC9145346.1 hypothetical protein [Arthrobacter sp. zg-Y919]MDK1276574.1 hypothetical protein [Arthrobacter sp. zg.Y919]MDM7989216.1 hypothetical protein [Arthrobacter sp. zg-Y877]WIB01837.1 hypothetical protein QNO10_07470 [Arthrobacter sp. zg-Y919]
MTTAALPLARGGKTPADKAERDDRDRERVQIRAARLRLTTDRKLGKPTPEWVRKLADRPL